MHNSHEKYANVIYAHFHSYSENENSNYANVIYAKNSQTQDDSNVI